ncbi:signal peptidase II [Salsipaludibacter albus]|uniref:signal peptidase II n=1 Tax=Salsipaludibacter albus TaxID=2849650 RepID=UPI001EE4B653|nr:signal peptidase II [Salsipaludibacter albus]MBY5163203.1 signal peptidase II [Salsipaludibacter albus]
MDATTEPDAQAVDVPDAEPAETAASRRSLALGLGVAAAVVVLDQVVKYVVEQVLDPGVFVPWLSDDIGWQLVYNDGGAFGLPMPSWFFLVVTTVVVVVVVRNLPRVVRALPTVAYGLLLAGALGNVIDRLVRAGDPGDPRFLHGHVVDFVAWGSFPRFNVADAAITIGFVLLAWDLWRTGEDGGLPGTSSDDATGP